jgi:hypothetical protein
MSIYIFFTLRTPVERSFGSGHLRKFFFNLLLIFFLSVPDNVFSQHFRNFFNPDMVSDNIKTVQFHREGWPMSYPLITHNSNQKLFLSFDELGTEIKNYYYSVELCNSDWSPSMLMKTEYYRGDEMVAVEDYEHSFNTTFDYVHYELTFPNENSSVLLSGNYVIKIFENYNQQEPVLIKRFMVNEQRVSIDPNVRYTMQSSERDQYQEIDFEVTHQGFNIQDPTNEIKVTILQNGRTDNAVTGLRPVFVGKDRMDFNYNREVIMEGGNEFRWLDLRSLRFQSDHVADITFSDPFYHVDVFTDYPQGDKPYYYHRDFNGRYYVEIQEEQDPQISADYVFVHFSLNWIPPLNGKEVYLTGAVTNWLFNENSRMKYNFDNNLYTLTLLLKQGYYNYQFVLKEEDSSIGSVIPIEGSFGQSENDYLILVYYCSVVDRHDRLIGATIANSVNK